MFTQTFLTSELPKNGYNLKEHHLTGCSKDLIQYDKGLNFLMIRKDPNFNVYNPNVNYTYNIDESATILKSSGIYNTNQTLLIDQFVSLLHQNFSGEINNKQLYI